MGKVDENKQLKQQNLMAAAFELFTTKGIVQTTITDIVQKSGVAKGTFYQYFKDKYDLREKLVAHHAEKICSHAIEHSGYQEKDSVEDRVVAILDDILDQFNQNKLLLKFINRNLSYRAFRSALEKEQTDYFSFFQKLLGMEDRKQVSILIYMIVEFAGSSCYSVILHNDPVSFEEYKPYLDQTVKLMLKEFTSRD